MIRRYQRGSVRKKNGNYVLRYREDSITPAGKAEWPQKTVILGAVSAFHGKNEARKAADRIMQEVNQAAPRPQVSVTLGWSLALFRPDVIPQAGSCRRREMTGRPSPL